MAPRDDWYRSADWSPEAQRLFEEKLRRVRKAGDRCSYLSGKATALLATTDPSRREAGILLLRRVIAEEPEVTWRVAGMHERLGKAYEQDGRFDEAEKEYRRCLEFYAVSRSGTTGACEIWLAEVILRTGQSEKYPEAHTLLVKLGESQMPQMFNNVRFRYVVAQARLASRMGRTDEAAEWAQAALILTEVGAKPAFPRHPQVGLVQADPSTLEEMRKLAKTS
jgi:tetratricopeptide (TPR) repeat protein